MKRESSDFSPSVCLSCQMSGGAAAAADQKSASATVEPRYIFPFTGSIYVGHCQVCNKQIARGTDTSLVKMHSIRRKGGDQNPWDRCDPVAITCKDNPVCIKIARRSLWKAKDEIGTGLPLHRIKNWCLGGRVDLKQTYVHFSQTEQKDVPISPTFLRYLEDSNEWGLFSYNEGVKRFTRWDEFLRNNWKTMIKTMCDAQTERRKERAPPPVAILWPHDFPKALRRKYQKFAEEALEDLYMIANHAQ